MRKTVGIAACSLLAVIAYAELPNVQVGRTLKIGPDYWMHQSYDSLMRYHGNVLTLPALSNLFQSAANSDTHLSATFGGVSIEIGMKRYEVMDLLSSKYSVLQTEPDRGLPDARNFQIIDGNKEEGYTHLGGLLFDKEQLVVIGVNLGRFDASDSGSIITTIVSALESANNENDDEPQIRWDMGMYDGDKHGNTELKFDFDHMAIKVVYYDMPRASQLVSVTQIIGTPRWRAFPTANDFQDD